MSLLIELQQIANVDVKVNEPLAPYTSFGIGGPADILVTPHSLDALRAVIRLTFGTGEVPTIIGNGTNLLILDKGIRGVVLRISNDFSNVTTQDNLIIAESGARLGHLCRISSEAGLTGLEWASGIPGALGGALVMNAGAHGGEIEQLVQSVSFIHPDGSLEEFKADQLTFGYRTSSFQNMPGIIAGATLCLKHADTMEIHKLLCETIKLRCDKQPVSMPSAGSVFKRPPNDYAGRLVEESGCKGLCVGGAMVSEKHANFIVNTGNATAADVLELIRQVQEAVYNHFKITLETEVRVIGTSA